MTTLQKFTILALSFCFSLHAQAAPPIRYSVTTEPPNLNTLKSSDSDSTFVTGHILEGLMRYSASDDGSVEPGVAESATQKGLVFTFKLRAAAKWSDGKPVTSKDFLFAWRRVVDPKTASEYANFLFPVKNAEKIVKGELKPEDLAVSAPDDRTLIVTLERPCEYFLTLTALSTLKPVRQDFYETKKDRYGADVEDLLYNGPYKLTSWVHGASMVFEKNPYYWDPALPKSERIEIPYFTKDATTRFNLFKTSKIHVLSPIGKDGLPLVKDAKIPTLVHQTWGIQSLFFNFKNPQSLTANRDFRKAVAIALEAHSQEYLSTAIGVPGIIRTYSWVPLKMKGVTKTFLSEYPAKKPSSKLADAKKFMESAKKSMGGTLPRITFLTTDSPGSVRQAAFLQQIFKNDLGVEMVLDYQIWKVLLSKSSKGEFDMMTFGWVPDYADPLNYFEVFTSTNGNNLGKWNSPAFDRAIDLAVKAKDRKSHMDALGQAQALLLDEQVIVPAYENADIWVKNPKIKGVLRRVFGPDPDFTRAVIE